LKLTNDQGISMRWERLVRQLLGLAASTALLLGLPALSLAATSSATTTKASTMVAKASTAKKATRAKATKRKKAKRSSRSAAAKLYQTIATATGSIRIASTSLLVMDEATSDILLSKNADVALPIASITKLMTAMVVLEAKQPLDELIEITQEDRLVEPHSRLTVGTQLTRQDLLHLALMSSENRAANALARTMPGGFPAAIEAMNMKAQEIGMKQTRFSDATGLSSQNIASPADLSRLVIEASRNGMVRDLSTSEFLYVPTKAGVVEFRNTNSLVGKPDWSIALQKTGYTSAAGRCLVMKAIVQDRPVIMVLMNSFGKLTRVADASRIRDWMEQTSMALGSTAVGSPQ
jgi:serine-type D-Ala-D-Ala endopeptidase (penicillin-binding protein 7)